MNLRFVEAFYWVVQLKSVSRAAEKLHITQSAMSSRIAALEAELGVLLLDRRDKQFRLTVGGLRFFGHTQRLLALQREMQRVLPCAPVITLGTDHSPFYSAPQELAAALLSLIPPAAAA